jgi:hypothetical protein
LDGLGLAASGPELQRARGSYRILHLSITTPRPPLQRLQLHGGCRPGVRRGRGGGCRTIPPAWWQCGTHSSPCKGFKGRWLCHSAAVHHCAVDPCNTLTIQAKAMPFHAPATLTPAWPQTYSNACTAGCSEVAVAYKGECGSLSPPPADPCECPQPGAARHDPQRVQEPETASTQHVCMTAIADPVAVQLPLLPSISVQPCPSPLPQVTCARAWRRCGTPCASSRSPRASSSTATPASRSASWGSTPRWRPTTWWVRPATPHLLHPAPLTASMPLQLPLHCLGPVETWWGRSLTSGVTELPPPPCAQGECRKNCTSCPRPSGPWERVCCGNGREYPSLCFAACAGRLDATKLAQCKRVGAGEPSLGRIRRVDLGGDMRGAATRVVSVPECPGRTTPRT